MTDRRQLSGRPSVEIVPLAAVENRARELRTAGRDVQSGWRLPDEPWLLDDLSCAGTVDSPADAGEALTAVYRGCNLVVAIGPRFGEREAARFLADLGDLADTVEVAARPEPEALPLSDEQVDILRRLAAGTSIPAAAEELYLSVRTCERRVGQARKALGVRSTAEAIAIVLTRHPLDGGI